MVWRNFCKSTRSLYFGCRLHKVTVILQQTQQQHRPLMNRGPFGHSHSSITILFDRSDDLTIIDEPFPFYPVRNRRYEIPWLSNDAALLIAQLRHNNNRERCGYNTTNRARRCWQYDNIVMLMDVVASRLRVVRRRWHCGNAFVACAVIIPHATRWGRALYTLTVWDTDPGAFSLRQFVELMEGDYALNVILLIMSSAGTSFNITRNTTASSLQSYWDI